jgi:hypothetical protein
MSRAKTISAVCFLFLATLMLPSECHASVFEAGSFCEALANSLAEASHSSRNRIRAD